MDFWFNDGFIKEKSGNTWKDVSENSGGNMTRQQFIDISNKQLDEDTAFNSCLMERSHCFIQTLFPINVASSFQPQTPYLDDKTKIELILKDPRSKKILEEHTNLYLKFLDKYQKNIFVSSDHNHNRITRVLQSLRLFGMLDLRDSFYRKVKKLAGANNMDTKNITYEGFLYNVYNEYWHKEAMTNNIGVTK